MEALRIGYVGLGNMGGALARRLMASGRVTVFDAHPANVATFVSEGAVGARSLGDLATTCDVIFLCLPTSDTVRQVLFGNGGIVAGASPGLLLIDQTSGDPAATRSMATELAGHGIDLVDAPVSGGAPAALAGTIAIMVGAGAHQYERARPVLEAISPNLFHAGHVGAGHAIKLVNNLISCTQRFLSFEALALAAGSGIKLETALQILTAGGARNAYLDKIAGKVLGGDLDSGFTLALAHKDLKLACEMGESLGSPTFLGGLAKELHRAAMMALGADARVDRAALLLAHLGSQIAKPL